MSFYVAAYRTLCISRGVWRYLILQPQFFFLDMEKGYTVFFIDYISIIVLFAAITKSLKLLDVTYK